MNYINEIVGIINAIALVMAALGGTYAFLRAKNTESSRIQTETIAMLKQQIDAIKEQVELLSAENTRLKQIIETIQIALKQKNILISIDGDMIVIEEEAKAKKRVARVKKEE